MLGLLRDKNTLISIPDWTTEDFRTVLPWIQENGWVQDGQVAPIDFYFLITCFTPFDDRNQIRGFFHIGGKIGF